MIALLTVLAAHVAANARRGQARGVEVDRTRNHERVGLAPASSIYWRRQRKFIKAQPKLTDGPLQLVLVPVQSEYAYGRVQSLLVGRGESGRYEIGLIGRYDCLTTALINAAGAQ